MENNPQLTMSKITAILVTVLPALAMGFILYNFSALLSTGGTAGNSPLLTALINMTICSMVAVIYFFAIGSINSLIFLYIAKIKGSRWPKQVACAGGAIIWAFGLITSLTLYIR